MVDETKVADETTASSGEDETAKSESLAEATEKTGEAEEKTEGEAEKKETSEAEAETSAAEEKKDEAKEEGEEDELERLLREPEEKKDNVQRRINALTAQLKSTKEELSVLKEEKALKEGKLPEYTDGQLKGALKKALEEGDADVVFEIMDYRQKKTEERLRNEYLNDQQLKTEAVKQSRNEWTQVLEDFEYLVNPKETELYKGSHQELDLTNESSLLYQLAISLYQSANEETRNKYQRLGGQRQAVLDALTRILRERRKAPEDKEKAKLKRQLTREKMKKSLGGTESMAEEKTPKRALSDKEKLDEYIKERQSNKRKTLGETL